MRLVNGVHGRFGAETVNDGVNERAVKLQPHRDGTAVIHIEDGLDILPQIEGTGQGVPRLVADGEARNAVHAVMAIVPGGGIVGHQIVMPVHTQRHGVGEIRRAVTAERLFAADRPVEVAEGDLAVFVDGGVDAVHGVVELFIIGAGAVHHIDLTAQLTGVGLTGQTLQLADQLHALARRQKRGGLHHIDEHFQLRQLEIPLAQKVAVGFRPDALNIHAVKLQEPQVVIDALALGTDAAALQIGDHVLHGFGVLLIGLLLQKTGQIQQLQLLVCHVFASFVR